MPLQMRLSSQISSQCSSKFACFLCVLFITGSTCCRDSCLLPTVFVVTAEWTSPQLDLSLRGLSVFFVPCVDHRAKQQATTQHLHRNLFSRRYCILPQCVCFPCSTCTLTWRWIKVQAPTWCKRSPWNVKSYFSFISFSPSGLKCNVLETCPWWCHKSVSNVFRGVFFIFKGFFLRIFHY